MTAKSARPQIYQQLLVYRSRNSIVHSSTRTSDQIDPFYQAKRAQVFAAS